MDLRVYYEKIRKIEAGLPEPFVVIVSHDTPDGGKRGIKTDVPRKLAARLIAEEKAELASPEEAAQFRAEAETKRMTAAEEEMEAATLWRGPQRVPKVGKKS
jgi:hypothetical protein